MLALAPVNLFCATGLLMKHRQGERKGSTWLQADPSSPKRALPASLALGKQSFDGLEHPGAGIEENHGSIAAHSKERLIPGMAVLIAIACYCSYWWRQHLAHLPWVNFDKLRTPSGSP